MSKTKTFVGRLLAHIWGVFGSIFQHVMEGARETFNQLPQETKDALIHGSGIIALINSMIDKTPDQVREAIKEQFPDVDEPLLEAGLYQIAHTFNLAPKEGNLEDTIALLQTYLSAIKGTAWESVSHTAASVLGIILAPANTKFGAIVTLVEYVYQKFFGKK